MALLSSPNPPNLLLQGEQDAGFEVTSVKISLPPFSSQAKEFEVLRWGTSYFPDGRRWAPGSSWDCEPTPGMKFVFAPRSYPLCGFGWS